MNIFGLDIALSKSRDNHNGDGCVKKGDCERIHDTLDTNLETRFTSLKDHIDTRIDDLKDFINSNGHGV